MNADEGIVTTTATGPELVALVQDTNSLADLDAAPWAKPAIQRLLAAGVVAGFPDGTFQPNTPVTRAQFVKMLSLTTGVTPGTGMTAFSDVPPGAWFAPYVSAEVAANVVDGITPTRFGSNQPVTREQLAVLLTRALHLTGSAPMHFLDAGQIDPYALAGVESSVAGGYLHGFPDHNFRPLEAATRAQVAQVLATVWANRAEG